MYLTDGFVFPALTNARSRYARHISSWLSCKKICMPCFIFSLSPVRISSIGLIVFRLPCFAFMLCRTQTISFYISGLQPSEVFSHETFVSTPISMLRPASILTQQFTNTKPFWSTFSLQRM